MDHGSPRQQDSLALAFFGAAAALLAGLLLYVLVVKAPEPKAPASSPAAVPGSAGTFAAGHPSHVNTRFPGFFMHASYFPPSLKEGQRLALGWPWQPVREGRTPDESSTRIVAELQEFR